jgi:aldehyde dehydrogenase (NAD+)
VREGEFAERVESMVQGGAAAASEEVELSIERLFHYAAYADKFGGNVQETQLYGLTASIHEPVGVIGMACPDTNPLLGFVSLVSPAVVRGNTCVVIPSQSHPLAATDLYQVGILTDIYYI